MSAPGKQGWETGAPWHLNSPDTPPPDDHAVHVFSADLDAFHCCLEDFHLSDIEQQRAARYKSEKVRDRFMLRRGVLRRLLAGFLHTNPKAILIEESGKPRLQDELASGCLDFSVSGCENRALYAFAWNRRVGIDLENMSHAVDCTAIALQFFTAREAACIEKLPPLDRSDVFYDCWTRKEAYIKAAGIRTLNSFDTGIVSGVFADLSEPIQDRQWTFIELPSDARWKACLALEKKHPSQAVRVTIRQVLQ